ncbi:hypothetical protein D2E26_0412 [Bifidobacterium dolichotidis]|uniref:PKD domain-containing protein n=1 Tax=Bifidobacterium dolichotidis TaxID=2306976 RepID=A0A430FSL1_9BIFI|nr:hypothetical protein [Bifidobacterium dolichotidis]RSX55849.1 hypothetical protein D2E26_0412 [Bifidobacterium dolichotidis]
MKRSIRTMVCAAALVPAMLMSMVAGSASANEENNLNDEVQIGITDPVDVDAQVGVTNPVDVDAQASVSNGSTVEIKPQRIEWQHTSSGAPYGYAVEDFLWTLGDGGTYEITMTTSAELYYRTIIRTGPSYHKVSVVVRYKGVTPPKELVVHPWYSREYQMACFPFFPAISLGYTPKEIGTKIKNEDLFNSTSFIQAYFDYSNVSTAESPVTAADPTHFVLSPAHNYTVDYAESAWFYGRNPRNHVALDVVLASGEKITGKFSIQLP